MAALPIPPDVLNTRGVKEPRSTSRTRCSYARHFSLSCLLYQASIWVPRHDSAYGLNTLTSKNALCCCSPKNPHAFTSNRAESSLLAVACDNCSPVSSWRKGSTHTSWHTSGIQSAVRSRTSLWRMIGNPPVGQFRA